MSPLRNSTPMPPLAEQFAALWDRAGAPPDIFDFLEKHTDQPPRERADVILIDQVRRNQTGELLPVERYLERCPDIADSQTLVLDLVYGEYRLCPSADQPAAIDDLIKRFPDLQDALTCQLEVADWRPSEEELADATEFADNDFYVPPVLEEPAPLGELPTTGVGGCVGRYRLLDVIHTGGMGTVYRAQHTLIDRLVALKVMRPELVRNARAVKRFLQEAQACINLIHPNIVTTYDVDQDGELLYLTMEMIAGQDLHCYVKERGPMEGLLAVDVILQVTSGLAYAHKRQIVHRDIKPQNIMLTPQFEVKILDLGLARLQEEEFTPGDDSDADLLPEDVEDLATCFASRLTSEGALMGTLPYMSPEQARNARRADVRSDIYSLGCTFYYLLTGEHAFKCARPPDTLKAIFDGNPVPPHVHRPEVSESLSRIVLAMMAVDPKDRFQSATEVREVLEDWSREAQESTASRKLLERLRRELTLHNRQVRNPE